MRQPLRHLTLPQRAARPFGRRFRMILSIPLLTALTILATAQPLAARHAPTRHDRRPDRESRIRYPRPRPQPSTSQNSTPLFSPSIASESPPSGSPEEGQSEEALSTSLTE